MKLLRLLLPYLLISTFFSCKKSDLLIVNAGTSYFRSNINAGQTRVFSSTGEISDPGIIARFVRDDNFYFESISNPYNTFPALLDSIVFADPLHAVVSADLHSYNCNVENKFPNTIFNRTDTSLSVSYGEVITHHITYYIGKIKPMVLDENISSSSGNNYIFSYKVIEKYVGIPEKNQLTTPLLQFIIHGKTGSNNSFQFYRINNILQPDFYHQLPAGDTVVLSEYRILYNKK